MVVCGLLTAVVLSSAACLPERRLDPNLCMDVAGTLPSYLPRLPGATPNAVRPMLKLTLRGPESHCNDGSPAVAFIRPAPIGSPDMDKWIIFFDGGGSCSDPDTCLERFCTMGADPAVFEVAGKMSSLGQPDAIDPPNGIFSTSAANDFSEYNHVHLAYCSSDSWIGSSEKKLVFSAKATRAYEIEFRGEPIVDDLIDTLRDGRTWADPRGALLYYNQAMPDLDHASRVVFSGESAGGSGMRHHVDRLADLLALNNRNPAGVEILAVVDAGLGPALHEPTIIWNSPTSPLDYDDMGITEMRPRFEFWEGDVRALDASCMSSGMPDYYCMDTLYTVLNEISTPMFVRSDLTDHLAMARMVTAWGLFSDPEAFANETATQFGNLPAGSGAFAPQCNQHVMIQSPGFSSTIIDGGTGLTFHDLLSNWVDGAGLTVDIQQDFTGAGAYTPSIDCP
jgi:hypothetical protein